jgi:hypothetical protein
MKAIRLSILVLLFLTACIVAVKEYQIEQQKIHLKKDLVELSKIKYGLFNVDEWKVILAEIITKKVEEFNLDDTNREEMRIKISKFLHVAIDDLESRYYEEKSQSFFGFIQGGVAAVTGTFGKIKKDIPVFTEQILDFLNDEDNREAIRGYLIDKINEYADDTFSDTDYTQVNLILQKYKQQDITQSRNYLRTAISQFDADSKGYKILLVLISIATLLLIIFLKRLNKFELIVGLSTSLILLLLGVFLPMIEIDARIAELTFSLLGEKVTFSDQVLYYKSKSILEVVKLMMSQSRLDLIAVGFLVLTFSVLFPFAKLISSVLYLQNERLRTHPFISFMVLKSGKWSMADVMVIAIFMAYIGFDGIISEQLRQLENMTNNLSLLSTNKSNLLFGFYAFTLFVLLSLTLSQKIQATLNHDVKISE